MKTKAIYIRLTKVGSCSTLEMIENNPCLRDRVWTRRKDEEKGNFADVHSRAALSHKKYLGDEMYNSSFVFATVRDPYDRIVSIWKYLCKNLHYLTTGDEEIDEKRTKIYTNRSFKKFVNLLKDHDLTHVDGGEIFESSLPCISKNIWWHLTPLAPHLTDENNNLMVDKVCRLEILEDEINSVCKSINCPPIKTILHRNKTDHKHYSNYYDSENKKIVENLYGMDIELFKYKFEVK